MTWPPHFGSLLPAIDVGNSIGVGFLVAGDFRGLRGYAVGE